MAFALTLLRRLFLPKADTSQSFDVRLNPFAPRKARAPAVVRQVP
jgi:hypothetical protein